MSGPLRLLLSAALVLPSLPGCADAEPNGWIGEASGAGSDGASDWPVRIAVKPRKTPRFERVLLVTVDTVRADHLSCYGYPRRTSPFLDRLADRGALFTRALTSISHTAPAHATLFTGLPPASHGVVKNGMRLHPDAVGIPDLFRAAGYQTAAFYNVKFLAGVDSGFDVARAAERDQGGFVIEAAERWLRDERRSDRFFLWLHLYDPHHWQLESRTPERELADVRAQLDWSEDELYRFFAELHGFAGTEPEEPRDELLALLDTYDAQILRADRLLQRFHDALAAEGLAGETLWVVTSDHGEGLGGHGYAGHGKHLYNEQLRVPLIVHASDGSFAGRRVDALVQHVDLLPTFADLLGARVEGLRPGIDGRSLLPLLEGRADWPERLAFAERAFFPDAPSLRALQDGRYKLLLHGDGRLELFDLERDPLELEDLGRAAEAARLESLLRELTSLHRARAPEEAPAWSGEVPADWAEELRALGYGGE